MMHPVEIDGRQFGLEVKDDGSQLVIYVDGQVKGQMYVGIDVPEPEPVFVEPELHEPVAFAEGEE